MVVPALVVALAVVALLAVWRLGTVRPSPSGAAAALASALSRNRLGDVHFANTSSVVAAESWNSTRAGMAGATATISVAGLSRHGDAAGARLRWIWRLPFGHRWSYEAVASLRYSGGKWRPVWSSSLVHPRLKKRELLRLSLRPPSRPSRAPILAADGRPIVAPRSVVNVGIEPKRVRNLRLLVRRLHALLGVLEQPLVKAVRAAPPNGFVPVITLRRTRYEQLRSKIHPLPGTVFTTGMLPLAPTRSFARSLLGTTGQATAQTVAASHGRVAPGEIVGLSGLEKAFDSRLGGAPGLVVQAAGSRGAAVSTLYALAGKPGRPLKTSLEMRAQEAADAALAGVAQPSALVAIRISTGTVIASAVGPDPVGYDIAFQGEYPPGSTFKIVTALALLERGEQPSNTVPCPAQLIVDGKQFRNAEQEALGATSFERDFAHSCNTAFASLAPRVGGGVLPTTARMLGIGRPLNLGVPVFAGSVPTPRDPVELAADAFGQGRILVSPLVMAAVAAAVARGRWEPPRLILDPPPATAAAGPALPARPLATLRTLLRDVVTFGTGTALATQPGPPVYGKTGTAETGSQNPPRTDAWFVGYQGDIAFATLVANTDNGLGGTTAAPIIARFLSKVG
jgi:cell division protein FtsI/penicillin-binding protein 2